MDSIISINGNEQPHALKVLICVLCHYERSGWISPSLMDFLVGLRYNNNYASHITKAYNFIPAAGARNFFGEQVKYCTPKPDWCLLLDNDMGPPDNLLDTIKDAPDDAMVVVPKFYLWDENARSTKLCWGLDDSLSEDLGDGRRGFKFTSKFYEINKCGTGAIFIKPEVFEKLPAPWFEYKYNNLGNMVGTEDISFCEKLVAAGLKMYGNASIQVSHFHTVDLRILNMIIHGDKAENSAKVEEKSAGKQVGAD